MTQAPGDNLEIFLSKLPGYIGLLRSRMADGDLVPSPSDTAVASFRYSMPERYRASFDGEAIRQHAAIVGRRAGFLVHLEIWHQLPDGGAVLCVVADDRPGLLSLISASLVVNDINIIAVKAYTRTDPEKGRTEAVDFLWMRRETAPALRLVSADIARIGQVLTALISGEATV